MMYIDESTGVKVVIDEAVCKFYEKSGSLPNLSRLSRHPEDECFAAICNYYRPWGSRCQAGSDKELTNPLPGL